jgi:DNA-binding MarR family transcriptional regulator
MSDAIRQFADIDRVVHEPARLALLTALSACAGADFVYLQRLTGLSKGNLSGHLAKLEGAGLVQLHKQFVGKTPRTTAHLTDAGRQAVERYWQAVDQLRAAAEQLALDGAAGAETPHLG